MKPSRIFVSLLAAAVLPAYAADAVPIRVCSENDDSYPWILKDRPGLTASLLMMAEKRYGAKIELIGLPWKRCTEETKAGTVDGAVKISYSAERAAELAAYPMKGDKPDDSKHLLIDTYSLYRMKGSSVSWDGKVLKADGPVAAQSGFSVVKQLQGLGVKVDDGSRAANDNLRKLLDGRVVAVALQTEEGDASLVDKKSDFQSRIEKMTPVLVEKPYFLAFSKQFYAKNPKAAEAVWNAIAAARESAEYKDLVKKFK